MTPASMETREMIARLEAALAANILPQKDSDRCARLAERLRRPVRVSLFGLPGHGGDWLLRSILGQDPVPGARNLPTMEITYATAPNVTATLDDGMVLQTDGLPGADILDHAPVFLDIGLPIDLLRRMSFLFVSAGGTIEEQSPALIWAASRTDIAIWCSRDFVESEAILWDAAPDRLKNHAFLVATDPELDLAALHQAAAHAFAGVFSVPRAFDAVEQPAPPRPRIDDLLARLQDDIDEAHRADVDAAELFLHRVGADLPEVTAPVPDAPPAEAETSVATPPAPVAAGRSPAERAATRAYVSEPILFLKRRARALTEMIEWPLADGQSDWSADVLEHCCETAEGLRDRAANWPEDDPGALELRDTLDEACDMTVLLQMEGGASQAEDAAMLLAQIREEFERKLAA